MRGPTPNNLRSMQDPVKIYSPTVGLRGLRTLHHLGSQTCSSSKAVLLTILKHRENWRMFRQPAVTENEKNSTP